MGFERLVRTVVLDRLKRRLPLKCKKSLDQKTREQTDAYKFIVYLSSTKYGLGHLLDVVQQFSGAYNIPSVHGKKRELTSSATMGRRRLRCKRRLHINFTTTTSDVFTDEKHKSTPSR